MNLILNKQYLNLDNIIYFKKKDTYKLFYVINKNIKLNGIPFNLLISDYFIDDNYIYIILLLW